MLGGPDSFAAGNYARTPVGNLLPVYVDQARRRRQSAASTSIGSRSRAKAGCSRGSALGKPSRKNATGWRRCRRFASLTPIGEHQAGRDGAGRSRRRSGGRAPGAGGAAIRPRPLGGAADRRFLAVGHAAAKRQGERPGKILAADGALAGGRRAAPRRGGRSPAGRFGNRRRDGAMCESATPSICRSTTPRWRSKSRRPTARSSRSRPSRATTRPGAYQATHVPRQPGAYRATVDGKAPDGSAGRRARSGLGRPAGRRRIQNLAAQPAALEEIAAKTGGEVIDQRELGRVRRRPADRKAPITEPWIRPPGTIRCFTWRSSAAWWANGVCAAGRAWREIDRR